MKPQTTFDIVRSLTRRLRFCAPPVALAITVVTSGAGAQDTAFAAAADSIRSYIRQGAFPSAAVAVAKDGRIVYQKGFGWADRERRMAADEHTMYSLASISKPMTATGLMMLVDQGRVDLDAPVNRYLGSARLTSPRGDAERATVRNVMSHMAGLPLHYEFFYENEDHAERAMDSAITRYGILVNPPGEVYQYSNLGYGILDEVIARVSGTSYASFMRQHVFLPLDMTRTSVHIAPGLEAYTAQRYMADGSPIPFYDFDHDGGSAVWSSAHDLVRFGMFHLDAGLSVQREILSRATRNLMQQPLTPASGNSLGYALGWSVAMDRGKRRVSHTGGMPGVSTALNLYPEENVVIVVLTNESNNRVGRIAEDLAAAVMPDYAARLTTDRARSPAGGQAGATPFRAPAQLIGSWQGTLHTYENTLPMTLVVQPDGDIHAAIGDQPATLLNGASFDERSGNLTGRFLATIPTEDARRHPHTVLLNVHLRSGVLSGQASAQTVGAPPIYFALTSYVELRKR